MTSDSDIGTARILQSGDREGRWAPVIGNELEGLLGRELGDSAEARRPVELAATSVLGKCIQPRGPEGRNTGLVVGYVQSGKTLSFTAVIALAHDNGFRLVVVLAGTKNNLAEQSRDRLVDDLEMLRSPARPWKHFHNPDTSELEAIKGSLAGWSSARGIKQTVVITVLKHASRGQGRINNLADLLERIPATELGAALIVDDEADQASLNSAVREGRESPTYVAIERLRSSLPLHSYLQYTATPQANILIPLIDLLSPDFCEVLEPGNGYTGGRRIFIEQDPNIVRTIPDSEIAQLANAPTPPATLLQALRFFLLGTIEGHVAMSGGQDPNPKNRTMMVHPSRLTADHGQFETWVRTALSQWKLLLDDHHDPGREDLLAAFHQDYQDLRQTAPSVLPDWDEVVGWLPTAIQQTRLEVVNSTGGRVEWKREWSQHYAWVLVGGQNLDRGFTVEGLTVTYMPRGSGTGLADTIQQRARFFGYKAGYIGLCRVFLESDVESRLKLYVESEESMRGFLRRHADEGALKIPDLRREFILDRSLQPTRRAVLLDPPTRTWLSPSGWWTQRSPHADLDAAQDNCKLVRAFRAKNKESLRTVKDGAAWIINPSKTTSSHQHDVAYPVSFKSVVEDLLSSYMVVHSGDLEGWQMVLVLLQRALESPHSDDLEASVIWMRPEENSSRGTGKDDRILALAQGATPPSGAAKGSTYAGDSEVKRGSLTVQVYTLDVRRGKVSEGGEVLARDVVALRVWLAPDLRHDILTQ